jgi:hypothetical protein
MPRLTICPHFLVDYPYDDPLEIGREIIKPLLDCLTETQKLGINLVIAAEILQYYEESYPWNQISDPKWRGYINNWYVLITSHLNRARLVNVGNIEALEGNSCSIISNRVNQLFNQFLSTFGNSAMPNRKHDEAIFINDQCKYPENLNRYYLFQAPKHLDKVKYPWLRIYKKPLPPEGDFPFVPPDDWRKCPTPKRTAVSHAYLDQQGNEWKWDQLHKDHWDVQYPHANAYKNITPKGKILSEKKSS